ncbi:CCA tRNA nucleotidyltransferase [Waterburya agarophytonicola K14]|uniref:CCA tRNA nucleotidyltransferase n=1 Tax=Waterburya agarophytonicola KI4 TaxID=2874699 RepID=A0A964BMI6_9CYAN|nr:CCA tRNA nucleotidyltransferase [Waterburya agarophytonicola]MCC0176085.1 CCA tRNA nucleotidyltransferase [Waterburya agarophytonicola KI4]
MSVEQIKLYLSSLDFPWDMNQLPTSAYLVGGSVRDALLQRYKTPLDLDFVLPENTISTAKDIANFYGVGFVILDKEREIARVVFPQGTLDFARQEGDSLVTDLKRRDFTINAIAYNVSSQQLIDPFDGVADLEQRVLRMISPTNLEDDPLRLLRAYRQAAQLDFNIESNTRKAICDRANLLSTIAPERVQAELNYIFTTSQGNKWLAAAQEDGLLQFWLPNIDTDKIKQLDRVENAIEVCSNLGLNQPELSILSKLATLVSTDEVAAEAEVARLKYSRSEIKAVAKTVKHLPCLQIMTNQISLREQYFWFLDVKDIFPILMVRAIATGVSLDLLNPLIERYLNPEDLVAHPQSLVTGNDLIGKLNLKPSPMIGTLLTEIQIAQIESKISTPQEALDFALFLLHINT